MKPEDVTKAALALIAWLTQSIDSYSSYVFVQDFAESTHKFRPSYLQKFNTPAEITTVDAVSSVHPPRQPHQPHGNGSRLLTFNETILHPSFTPHFQSVQWLPGSEDGQVIYLAESGDLVFENFITGNSTVFVSAKQIPEDTHALWIRSDQKKVLFATNYTKQYRHSYFADYSVLDVASGEIKSLVDDQMGDIQYAEFSPVGDDIAFVRNNNLFVHDGTATTQITNDGDPDMFNAVPDWVYEEEVFSDRYALWWSPDGRYIAYLSFNETGVGTFSIPYYMDNQAIPPVYPRELELRYPKAGSTNPTVRFQLLDVSTKTIHPINYNAFAQNDTVIGEVAWTTDDSSNVIYRAYNRVQDHEKLIMVETSSMEARVIYERDGSDGWLENRIAITFVGRINDDNETYFVDMSDESGWNHLYLFPVNGGKRITLTGGEWEVVSILKVDTQRQLVYYTSTQHHSTERHIYSVSYTTGEKQALVDDRTSASWSASFSAGGGYYILNYAGPDVPYQELYSVNNTTVPLRTVSNNTALYDKLQSYSLPNVTYLELEHPSGFKLNVLQRLPPNFDSSKKYPVLFNPYGGPNSQQVTRSFQPLGFTSYLASDPELQYITYIVDNRGTGNKGRAFRNVVTSHLGTTEPADQIWAAQQLIAMFDYIDVEHMAFWGWSYGGFLTSKVIETQNGSTFSLGLITAPVTDFRFYDSIYTERYMKLPSTNEAGYNNTAIRNPEGFKAMKGGFTILHGTGDDNVHYQNTAALVDLLVGAGVSPEVMDWRAFTDSAHDIRYNGATAYLYKYLTKLLYQEKNRVPGEEKVVHQWSKKDING